MSRKLKNERQWLLYLIERADERIVDMEQQERNALKTTGGIRDEYFHDLDAQLRVARQRKRELKARLDGLPV